MYNFQVPQIGPQSLSGSSSVLKFDYRIINASYAPSLIIIAAIRPCQNRILAPLLPEEGRRPLRLTSVAGAAGGSEHPKN